MFLGFDFGLLAIGLRVLWVAFDLRFEQTGEYRHLRWLRARADPFQEEEAADIVDDIGQPDLEGSKNLLDLRLSV
ncbi:MAG: hypothetical protein ABF459_16865 [Gluconobacter cerinus]|uniref:Uncharacterized protein n=1 Tax=Gluconobacter japonicus TaxID=376620 RepID=A0ABQ5WHN2_GLUJA|nr:hypothetical protein [Gluconobacter japonicus]GBR27810.1 hypothetical protein AA3271_2655 [Gluconobacter japonicus NBRC 3271]GLQ59698.1 hypothetical protein GCM10010937_15010 [Gluconobacter japonicus]